MSNKSLSIPIMPPKKIALCLSQLECHFDPDQVDNPQNLAQAYVTFLEWLMGISPDEMEEYRGLNEDLLPVHEEGVKNVLLARHVNNLFRAVCIDNHNVFKDHIKPSQKRVLHALSQVINFAIYREERIATFQQLSSESEQIASKRLECEQRHEDLLAELEHLKLQRAEAEPVIQSLSSDNRGLAEEIAELHSKESSFQKENTNLEQQIEEINRQNMKLEEDVNTLQQQVKRLKLQIVESPEKTQQYIEELRLQITTNLKELSEINQRHRDHLTHFETLNKAQKEVEKTTSLVNICTTAKEKGLEPKREIKETEIKIEEAERRIKELKTENEHFQKLIKHEEENAHFVSNRYRARITAAEQRLQNENRKLQIAQRESNETELKIKANAEQIRGLEQEKASTARKHNEDMSLLKQQFDDLENSVNDYQRRLISAMNGPL